MRTVVLEGEQLIIDALASGGHVHSLYFSSRQALQRLTSTERIENIYHVPHNILQRFSSLKTCPGLLAIFEVPDPAVLTTRYLSHGLWRPLPATLVLNGIRDPGNMGSLLRTAASFGLSSVLVSEG
ncbi:RNA methyltransferase-like protein 1B, partial [Clonorchis sinensis]